MKTPLNVKHWPVPSTIGTATAEDDLSTMMALEIQKEIDMVILQEFEAASIIEKQQKEAALRDEYPALMEAWEEYQVKLKLIEAGQLTK
jgi:hypothetical protein